MVILLWFLGGVALTDGVSARSRVILQRACTLLLLALVIDPGPVAALGACLAYTMSKRDLRDWSWAGRWSSHLVGTVLIAPAAFALFAGAMIVLMGAVR